MKLIETVAWALVELQSPRPDVPGVRNALEDICRDKAEHIMTNWQDEGLAELWESDASKIGRVKVHHWKAVRV